MEYDFSVRYIEGHRMEIADALSRDGTMTDDEVKARMKKEERGEIYKNLYGKNM